ncbi:MAG: ABC transporter substrate-binding protein, partial [Thermomicrobiales bacterium]|nr:ABC transporter substrate-binding protein [Thermomicrobiales bacterium]
MSVHYDAALTRRALLGAAALAAAGARFRRSVTARQRRATRTPTGPSDPPGPPQAGGTLVVGSTVEPVSLHPWDPGSAAGADVLEGVVEGLLRYNAAGRLQPALAEGFTISDDDLSYTFRLRADVRYHNGEPFAGTDLIAAWQARLDGDWTGPATAGWDRIAAMDLPDDRTLIVTTTEPYAPLLSTVAISPILPASAFADGVAAFRERFAREPIGSGPFRVAAWEPGNRITLERFADYWNGPARLERIEHRLLPDLDALLTGLATGEIDLAGGAGGVPAAEVDRALEIAGLDVWEHATPNWQHLDLKQVGFLRERAVRQALDFATPRQRIVD